MHSVRSDEYSFVEQGVGVPSIYIGEGYKTVDPKLDGKSMQIDWENARYHQPSDDMSQPFESNALVKGTRVDFRYKIAQHRLPHWNKGDFEQFAKPGQEGNGTVKSGCS